MKKMKSLITAGLLKQKSSHRLTQALNASDPGS